ncbi:MAG: triosephosphate isomerase [Candidatus Pacebacteria bacterium]|nr:triosephosphate isomerase [Candidatus Paceibacterota bacterium]
MKKELYVIGNWKMHPASKKEALAIVQKTKKLLPRLVTTRVVIVPPSIYLSSLYTKFKSIAFGLQTVATDDIQSHTGSISAQMGKNEGATFAIVGHSEVRVQLTNSQVGEMLRETLKAGLTPVLCIGERNRDHNGFYLHEIKSQIEEALAMAPKSSYAKIIIAYEPLWAIGKNALREATAEEFLEIAIFTRKVFSDIVGMKIASEITILYGGSADEKNITPFLKCGAEGFLLGRASLDPKKFSAVAIAMEQFSKENK